MLEKLKLKIACDRLGIMDRHAKLYVVLQEMARGGMTTEESFRIREKFWDDDFMDALERCAFLANKAVMDNGYGQDQIDDVERMSSDPLYRRKHFEKYQEEIKPLADQIGIVDIVRSVLL